MKHIDKIAAVVIFSILQACVSSGDMNGDSQSANRPDMNTAEPDMGAVMPVAETPAGMATGSVEAETETDVTTGAGLVGCEAPSEEMKQTMLESINSTRQVGRMCGDSDNMAVGLVSWNSKLTAAAYAHAQDMASNNFFNHTGSDGLSVSDRAEAAGYDWHAIGENIAAGQNSVGHVHQDWLDSPGHCRNIMNALYTEFGSACVATSNANHGSYWVVVFGDQR